MDVRALLPLGLVPLTVVAVFFLHWLTVRHVRSAAERLPLCRGAYLAFSGQLLLYGWIVLPVYSAGVSAAYLVPLGMTFSFVGDVFNLQFPSISRKTGEPLFYGILSFMAAQVCYIAAIVSLVSMDDLVGRGYLVPLMAGLVVVPAVLFRFRVYHPDRPKRIMRGALVYGFVLGAMAALAISAALAHGGLWWLPAAGAAFFLFSDAVMGETTVHGRHPVFEYQVPWVTYLAAQGLILLGFAAML